MLKVNLDVCVIYFNTSYVAVQLVIITPRMFLFRDFNTSYVAVQLFFWLLELELSYHFNTSYVAVQPSHRFRAIYCVVISIHLMLRFNRSNNRICIVYIFISIHLMLRFNSLKEAVEWLVYPFQYILCCGSTLNMLFSWILRVNFNTSYVAVQPPPYVRVTNNSFISIHLMLRFNQYHFYL